MSVFEAHSTSCETLPKIIWINSNPDASWEKLAKVLLPNHLLYSPRLRFTCGFYVNLIFTAKLLIFIMLFIFIAELWALLGHVCLVC